MDTTIATLKRKYSRSGDPSDHARLVAACDRMGLCRCTEALVWFDGLCFQCACKKRAGWLGSVSLSVAIAMSPENIDKNSDWILYSPGRKNKKSHINRNSGYVNIYFGSFCGLVNIDSSNVGKMYFDQAGSVIRAGKPAEASCVNCADAFRTMFFKNSTLDIKNHFEWNIRALKRFAPTKDVEHAGS